jgi:hypothetical protein
MSAEIQAEIQVLIRSVLILIWIWTPFMVVATKYAKPPNWKIWLAHLILGPFTLFSLRWEHFQDPEDKGNHYVI